MQLVTGRPMRGAMLEKLCAFLTYCHLDYDEHIDYTAELVEDGEIIACGSLDHSTLKCIAVAPEHQGEDLTAKVLTELRKEAFEQGLRKLMLYTKPNNQFMFQGLGFYPLCRTADCLLMEDQRHGLDAFLKEVKVPVHADKIGCIVAHCNPFTLGHMHLIETAARECDLVYVFILSEAGSMFAPETRLSLAKEACAKLQNVIVHESGPYMVSSATFPSYFLRDKTRVGEIFCTLDVKLFAQRIAPALGITHRYVGSEPLCAVTAQYNRALHEGLEPNGIRVCEIERCEIDGSIVSASRVRSLIKEQRLEELRPLVPDVTYELIKREYIKER